MYRERERESEREREREKERERKAVKYIYIYIYTRLYKYIYIYIYNCPFMRISQSVLYLSSSIYISLNSNVVKKKGSGLTAAPLELYDGIIAKPCT